MEKVRLCPPNSRCSDGWTPALGYTCECEVGYGLDGTPTRLIPVNPSQGDVRSFCDRMSASLASALTR